jgi:predicted PilT family ATPase
MAKGTPRHNALAFSDFTMATTDERLREMIRRARVNGSKFVIPRSMYDELIIAAKGGDDLAAEALEVCCLLQRIPTSRKSA